MKQEGDHGQRSGEGGGPLELDTTVRDLEFVSQSVCYEQENQTPRL